MNMVSSNLKKGMRYMKLEHIKGLEDETEDYYEQERLF
jgi:hypothetical protein